MHDKTMQQFRGRIVSVLSRRLASVLALAAAFSGSILSAQAGDGNHKRPFTVKDSIELSLIVNPTPWTDTSLHGEQALGSPIYSPDGKYFLLVTQRGSLAANSLEGTIWLFDRRRVADYLLQDSAPKPVPRKLVVVKATSNMPVLNDVRWTDDSSRITFLGKQEGQRQRLFIADVETGVVNSATRDDLYVTAYDIRGATIAYTVLLKPSPSADATDELVEVGERNVSDLLSEYLPPTDDIEEDLLRYPSSLHLLKDGHDVAIDFTMDGKPLRLFVPTLSLSPDGRSLITVAPVNQVSKSWEQYQPLYAQYRIKSGPIQEKSLYAVESLWRTEQFVLVDVETGSVSPLVNAPAGRDMGYFVATKAFWFADSRHAVLTNSYLPFLSTQDKETNAKVCDRSVLLEVNASTRTVQEIADLKPSKSMEAVPYTIEAISWDKYSSAVTLHYKSETDAPAPAAETYTLRSGAWIRLQAPSPQPYGKPESAGRLSIVQSLNQPPALWAQSPSDKTATLLWNPNPQLEEVSLGNASVYRWQDAQGRPWAGILVLPPHYDASRRYPLVIQTHGYDAHRFFVDGYATTANAGRALAAKDMIVLQMGEFGKSLATSEEGGDQLAGFESVIDHLTGDGMVDRGRVAIIGFSRTCFHVLYAMTHRPGLFAAATINDGVTFGYVEYMLRHESQEYRVEAEAINGGPPYRDALGSWFANAPSFNLDKISTPLLIPAFDKGIPFSAWEIYSGLRRLKKPVDMLWWRKENAPHILVQPSQRHASQQANVDWLDFWLNNHEDSDPTKVVQYARWRELRKLQEQSNAKPKDEARN
jgi:hypothetical protein